MALLAWTCLTLSMPAEQGLKRYYQTLQNYRKYYYFIYNSLRAIITNLLACAVIVRRFWTRERRPSRTFRYLPSGALSLKSWSNYTLLRLHLSCCISSARACLQSNLQMVIMFLSLVLKIVWPSIYDLKYNYLILTIFESITYNTCKLCERSFFSLPFCKYLTWVVFNVLYSAIILEIKSSFSILNLSLPHRCNITRFTTMGVRQFSATCYPGNTRLDSQTGTAERSSNNGIHQGTLGGGNRDYSIRRITVWQHGSDATYRRVHRNARVGLDKRYLPRQGVQMTHTC